MTMKVVLGTLLLVAVTSVCSFSNPKPKSWWMKRVLSDDYYTSGRMYPMSFKLVSESGIKTIISLYDFEDSEGGSASNDEAQAVAEESGIEHKTVLGSMADNDWRTLSALDALGEKIRTSERPILLYDNYSKRSTLLLLLHFARMKIQDSSDEVPEVEPEDIFQVAADMGFDFSSSNCTKLYNLVKNVTGYEVTSATIPTPKITALPMWHRGCWPVTPMLANWFILGQPARPGIDLLKETGFKTLVNVRLGSATQEEVPLLNIKDKTGNGVNRQTTAELEKHRIDANKTNEYIGPNSTVNYQSTNEFVFGDDIGYNESLERDAVSGKMHYKHFPITRSTGIPELLYSAELWETYKDEMLALNGGDDPVVVHCTVGVRAFVLAGMTYAYAEHKSSEFVLELGNKIGYDVAAHSVHAVKMLEDVLDHRTVTTEAPTQTTLGSAAVSVGCSNLLMLLFLAVTVFVKVA